MLNLLHYILPFLHSHFCLCFVQFLLHVIISLYVHKIIHNFKMLLTLLIKHFYRINKRDFWGKNIFKQHQSWCANTADWQDWLVTCHVLKLCPSELNTLKLVLRVNNNWKATAWNHVCIKCNQTAFCLIELVQWRLATTFSSTLLKDVFENLSRLVSQVIYHLK